MLLGVLEQAADARGPDADEHLDELGGRDTEEGNTCLAGDGAGKQRLAGARRTDQQDPLRHPAAQFLEFLRVAQEVHHLLELELRLLHAGHIIEGGLRRTGFLHPRPAAAEGENALGRLAAAPHEPDPDGDQSQEGQEIDEQAAQAARVLLDLGIDMTALQQGEEAGIVEPDRVRDGCRELGVGDAVVGDRGLEITLRRLALDGDVGHVAVLHLRYQLGVVELDAGRSTEPHEEGEEHDHQVQAEPGKQGQPQPGAGLARIPRRLGGRSLIGPELGHRLSLCAPHENQTS